MGPITVALTDEDREVVLIALAQLALVRPGWTDLLGRLASRLGGRLDVDAVPIADDADTLTHDDRRQLAAIEAEPDPIVRVGRIRAYWRDGDRADRTSRACLAHHFGVLHEVIDHLLAAQLGLDQAAAARLAAERAALSDALGLTARGRDPAVLAAARVAVARGAGHDCDEWRDPQGQCALCGAGGDDRPQ